MQSGYRTLSRATAFAAVIFFATISQGSAQFRCFTTPSSAGELNCGTADGVFEAASIEECCLSENGHFFEPRAGSEGCTACIVFGWIQGEMFFQPERTATYMLQAGFIKGGAVQTFVTSSILARFEVVIEDGSAVEGVNEDFIVPDTTRTLSGANPAPFSVPITLRLDSIALEPDEDFTLSLAPDNMNPTATMILAGGTIGMFVSPEIRVIIQDLENVTLQFTEVDYSNTEARNFIQPQLQLSTTIAVDLVVEVIPLNLNLARINDQLPLSLDPIQTDPNFDPDTQTATSVADFSIMPVQVTFASGISTQTIPFNMNITDDTIHEADQIFVLRLEVLSGTDRNRLVPQRTDGLTSLGRIIDDDAIPIGFEQERYTVFEAFNATGGQILIPVIKGNNLESELEFDVIGQFIDGSAQREIGAGTGDFIAIQPRVTLLFPTDEQFIEVGFILIQDRLPEDAEDFSIELTTSGAPRVEIGSGGLFGRATIVIIDNDELTIGWERNLTIVNETQGPLELCLIIRDVDEFDILTGFSLILLIGTVRGTAADPGDYTELRADSTFVIISDENRRVCIDVVINDDILLEEVEFFSVQIVPLDGLSPNIRLDPDLTFVEILDDDFVRIGFNQTTYTVTEGEDAVATVYVAVLAGGLQRMVSVTFSTEVLGSDTATAGDDFGSIARVLVFDENTLVVPVEIPITDDTIAESLETFTVSLVRDADDPIDEVIIDPDAATVFIRDTDAPPSPNCIVSDPLMVSPFVIAETYNFVGTCEHTLVTSCTDAVDFAVTVDFLATNLANGRIGVRYMNRSFIYQENGTVDTGSEDPIGQVGDTREYVGQVFITQNATETILSFQSVGVEVTVANDQFQVNVANSSTLGETCGLCGNQDGTLLFNDRTTVANIMNMTQVRAFANSWLVPARDQFLRGIRRECAQLTNDTVIGDPLFTVPFTKGGDALCYEVHGSPDQHYNLVSDVCTNVNAYYNDAIAMDTYGTFEANFIQVIGVRAVGSTGDCYNIRVFEDVNGSCSAMRMGAADVFPLGMSAFDGITVRRTLSRVRISVPNCENVNLVMWVTCEERSGVPTLRFDISRGLNLRPTSHGLIGQFWNINITTEPFTGTVDPDYADADLRIVTVIPADGPPRRFLAGFNALVNWDKSRGPCYYAGNGQGGPWGIGPDFPVIQGRYDDYQVDGLFEDDFVYAQFEDERCN